MWLTLKFSRFTLDHSNLVTHLINCYFQTQQVKFVSLNHGLVLYSRVSRFHAPKLTWGKPTQLRKSEITYNLTQIQNSCYRPRPPTRSFSQTWDPVAWNGNKIKDTNKVTPRICLELNVIRYPAAPLIKYKTMHTTRVLIGVHSHDDALANQLNGHMLPLNFPGCMANCIGPIDSWWTWSALLEMLDK